MSVSVKVQISTMEIGSSLVKGKNISRRLVGLTKSRLVPGSSILTIVVYPFSSSSETHTHLALPYPPFKYCQRYEID